MTERLPRYALYAFVVGLPLHNLVMAELWELGVRGVALDVVFSNAVIEHVGGREEQRRFVAEALRVGRRAFVTTPNRWFPIEVHTRLPLVHWLPEAFAHPAYDLVRKPWAKDNCLLGPGALRDLFPPEARIVNLGLTMAAIVA